MTISRPETHYTSVGDAQVAYQVLGDGPSDLLLFAGLGGHIELMWDDPLVLASIGGWLRCAAV